MKEKEEKEGEKEKKEDGRRRWGRKHNHIDLCHLRNFVIPWFCQ